MYTLKETLEKLNITKYKFDKLKKHINEENTINNVAYFVVLTISLVSKN